MLPFLTDKQCENIRQRMLNTIVDTLKAFMPKEMLGEGILKYGIKAGSINSRCQILEKF